MSLPQTLDFFLLAVIGNVFPLLLRGAMAGSNLDKAAEETFKSTVEGFSVDISWHAVAGSRYKLGIANLENPAWRAKIAMVSIVLEPFRVLAVLYISIAENVVAGDAEERATNWPPLVDLCNDVSQALQAPDGSMQLFCRCELEATLLAKPEKLFD